MSLCFFRRKVLVEDGNQSSTYPESESFMKSMDCQGLLASSFRSLWPQDAEVRTRMSHSTVTPSAWRATAFLFPSLTQYITIGYPVFSSLPTFFFSLQILCKSYKLSLVSPVLPYINEICQTIQSQHPCRCPSNPRLLFCPDPSSFDRQ